MTTKYQRQWTEFEVIKSIYEKEFEELKYPWKIDHPPWFKVNLKFDGNTSVGVEFRMSAAYPDVIPEILVQKTTNNCIGTVVDQHQQHLLGKDQLGYIRTKLVEQADELIGSEMVFDLIERAKDLIETLAKRGKSSFHSEMLERQEEVALNLQEKERLLEEKRLKAEERKRREEMESLERKIIEEIEAKDKKQNPKHSSTHFIASTNSSAHSDTRHSPKVYSFNPAVQVADGGRQIARVYEVERENYNNNSSKTVVNYNWPFGRIIRVSDYSKTNEEFDLKTVSLSHPFLQSFGGHRQLDTLIKKISSHSSELFVGKHENVIKCFGGSFSDEEENSKNMILLYEKTDEEVVPLKLILEQAGALTLPKVIEYLKQICSGLNHLHAAGIAHRELGIENIVLETKSSKIKISDYTVWRVLADLSRGHEIEFNGGKMVGYAWPAPEVAARPNFIGKKTDTWAVGRIAMQMIFGIDILDQCPVSECSRVLSSTRNDVLIQFVSCCLIEDSGKRPTIEDLMKSSLFTTHCISNLIMLQPVEVIKEQRKSPLSAVASFSNLKGNSRYKSDFEELEFLGRGGFGSVVKVRNKIDDRYYAVKKILLDPRDIEYNKKILREVTTLSRLHHERIIRYYQAWIEDNDQTDETSSGSSKNDYDLSTSSFGTATDAKSNVGIMNNFNFLQRDMVDFSLGPKSNTNRFSELQEENDDFFERGDGVFSDEKTVSTTEAGTDTTTATDMTTTTETETENESISTSDSDSKTTLDDIKSGPVFKSQCLYIQMEYCPNQTLRDLIDERSQDPSGHYLDPPEIWRLFRQIVEGLVHIHAQGMMHRDLKPSNIFLDSNGDVKIGDFGLAVTRVESAGHIGGGVGGGNNLTRAGSKAESILEHHSFTGESHTLNIGTPFYVSPEQQQQHRSETSKYNQKVDMYSLGIIFIELWVPFSTGMERVQRLRDCRLNEIKLPDGLDGSVIKICKRLLCHDPRTRYSSLELLKSDLLPPMLEEELMEEAMRTVAQPETAHYPRLISTIFQRQAQCGLETIRPKDFAFDVHSGNATEAGQFVTSQRIRSGIERIFHRHGAVEINPPLFYLPLHPSEDMFVVLDESGQRLELPNNLTRPFSRWVAQSNVKDLKRYAFDRVYKKISQVPGRQPYQPIEASFDIIHSNRIDDGILEECEVVRVAIDGVLSGGGGGGGVIRADQICLKLNNLKLRNMILNGREVKEEIISVGPLISWNRKENPYLECLDEEMIKILKVGEEGNNNVNLNLINRLMSHYSRSSEAKGLLVGLSRRLMMLQKISIPEKCKIVFDPLMSVGGEMFLDDFVFTVTVKMNKKLKGVELVSSGGRYDQMVEEFKFPTARLEGKGPFAVGCSIYVHKLRLIHHISSSSTHLDTSNQPAFRILIDKEINSDEMWLINEMWRNGIEFGLIEGEGGKKRVSSCSSSSSSNSNYYVLQVKTNTRSVRIGKAIRGGSEEVGFEWIIARIKKLLVLLEEESCCLAEDCSGNNNSTYEDDTNTYGTYNNNNSSNYSNNANNNHNHNTITTNNNNAHPHELNLHPILVGKSSNGISTMLREKVIKSIKPILQHRPEVIIHEVSRESIKRIISSFNTGNSTGGTGGSSAAEGDGEGEQKILQVINRIITNNAPSTNNSTSPTVGRMFIFYNHRDGNMEVMIKK